jgi:predicted Zn-dependent protease
MPQAFDSTSYFSGQVTRGAPRQKPALIVFIARKYVKKSPISAKLCAKLWLICVMGEIVIFNMRRHLRQKLALICLALGLSGCAGVDFSQVDFGTPNPAPVVPQVSGSALMARFGGNYDSPALQGQLESIAARLSQASGQKTQVYRVTILNSPQINAFALENGQLFITRGLLAYTNTADEVASVLSHEMAHIILRHAAKRREAVDEITRNASLMRSNANDNGATLANSSGILPAPRYSLAQFNQLQELEADRLGQTLMQKAGFDPSAAVRFLSNIAREDARQAARGTRSSQSYEGSFLSSHPSNSARIARAASFPVSLSRQAQNINASDYLSLLNNMVFGEAVSSGVFEREVFRHPVLGIRFRVPNGYEGENTAEAVFATGPKGELVRFDAASKTAVTDLKSYMSSQWLQNISETNVTRFEHLGRSVVWTRESSERVQFFFAALGWSPTKVYRFILIAPISDTGAQDRFLAMIKSLEPLSTSEAKALLPMRLSVVRLPENAAQAVRSYAAQSEFMSEDMLMILNGFESKNELTPGQLIKVINK